MYYEEAEVKHYTTISKKTGAERSSSQIHIKKKSKFYEYKKVGLVDIEELEENLIFLEANNVAELEAKINELTEINVQLEKELNQYKATNEDLFSENGNLKDKIAELQEDLLTEKNNSKKYVEEANSIVIDVKNKLEEKQEEHKEETKELNFQLNKEKDIVKDLLIVRSDFLKQNRIKSFFKIEPESSKRIAKLKELPEVEANISKE